MALGEKLREARMRRKLSTSEVAARTRMKVQLVEAIERDDFGSFAAPIYGKGFIRLFAESVGLDPAPLIEEYLAALENAPSAPPPPEPRPVPRHRDRPAIRPAAMPSGREQESPAPSRPAATAAPAPEPEPRPKPRPAPEPEPPAELPPDDLFAQAGTPAPAQTEQSPPLPTPASPEEPAAAPEEEAAVEDERGAAPAPAEAPRDSGPDQLPESGAPGSRPAFRGGAVAEAGTRLAEYRRIVLASARRAGQRLIAAAASIRPLLREIRFGEAPLKTIGIVVGVVVLLVFLFSAFSRLVSSGEPSADPATGELRLAIDPPDPYLE